ncbi:unnamed protein product [Parnassius apollo]|uniref:(apollo) hypothetical protein n=1 Tax=Parnassius apollo TaxID=110799 RepID=A0A8S3W2V7_PARAO|nr:unnamed protein product [Parnassius apollo]
MEFQEKEVILAPNRRGCKKISDKSTWKREVEKSKRYVAKGPPKIPQCVHRNLKQGYKCNELTTQDYRSWHFKFNASKRFFLRKDKNNKTGIKGEPNYVYEVINYGNVCKRGKSYENIKPTLILEFL